MCGLAGFIGNNEVDNEIILFKMLEKISHRGKDNRGMAIIPSKVPFKNVALGHNRLSIIDTHERANQPYKFKNLTIVFNGEIYNYKELKPLLASNNYNIETNSDTEVIVKLFHCYGKDSIKYLNGMFAIVIYDSLNERIYLIRDRMGVKPLVYYYDNNLFLFSSEIKSFFKCALIQEPLQLNRNLLANYFKYGYINSFNSVFQNVAKVENGQILTYDIAKAVINKEYYWQLNNVRSNHEISDVQEGITKFDELISSSVKYRFIADVDIGIFLSSGIDSNLILNIALNNGTKIINSFTYKNSEKKYNEEVIEYDSRVRQYNVEMPDEDLWRDFKILCANYDEPFSDPATLGLYSLSKFASNHNKVILVGDGGDELLGGYQFYENMYYANKWRKYRPLYSLISPFLSTILTSGFASRYLDRLSIYHALITSNSIFDIEDFLEKRYDLFAKKLTGEVYHNSYKDSYYNDDSFIAFLNYKTSTELIHQLNYKTDVAGMLNTVEIREPLLDYRLFELQQALKPNVLFNKKENINKKYILRKLLEKYDQRHVNIQKNGFKVDLEAIFKKNIVELDNCIQRFDSVLINADYCREIWNNYKKGRVNFLIINRLVSYILWEESLKDRL